MNSDDNVRVLVIDDEAPIRLLCRVNLEAEQMDVLEASDGPTGLTVRSQPVSGTLSVAVPAQGGFSARICPARTVPIWVRPVKASRTLSKSRL